MKIKLVLLNSFYYWHTVGNGITNLKLGKFSTYVFTSYIWLNYKAQLLNDKLFVLTRVQMCANHIHNEPTTPSVSHIQSLLTVFLC